MDLSHVIFSSELPDYAGSVYKLTLIDENITIGIPSGEIPTRNSETSITVPYIKDSDSNHISLLITNKNDAWSGTAGWNSGAVKQYYITRRVFEDTGTVTFTLPDDYETNKSNWKVWILAERNTEQIMWVNDPYSSDYASAPLEIIIPDVSNEISN